MATLARKLRVVDYFALGWGTMVGVGWLVVMDDWLSARWRHSAPFLASPSAARFCFLSAMCYGSWSARMPDAAAEIAYTAKVFPQCDQLCHRLDDGAGLLHRMSMGSRGRRQDCRLHLSRAEQFRTVSGCRTIRYSCLG